MAEEKSPTLQEQSYYNYARKGIDRINNSNRLGIDPEDYEKYEKGTLIGSILERLGYTAPQQDKYRDIGLLDPDYWKVRPKSPMSYGPWDHFWNYEEK
jgi:hypothetical protein